MSNNDKRPLALIILDGWGVSTQREGNAITLANTPYYDEICERYPSTMLAASGLSMGLPEDVPGNAEIGHRTIGAGRVIQTDATRVAQAVSSGDLLNNEVLRTAFARAVSAGSKVHFVGLLSDSGIHSSQESLFSLIRMAKLAGVTDAFVHGILDGRDVQPRTADIYVDALEIKMADIGLGKIASLCGRFYGMDGSENWERTARAYTMMVHGEGERSFDAVTAIRASFLRGISDEFIAPIVIEKRMDEPMATVRDGDLVVFFNHRAEPMQQLARSLAVSGPADTKPKIDAVTMVEYDPSFGLSVAFPRAEEKNLLTTIFEYCGLRNYRITELSRSAHVSAYLNGHAAAIGSYEKNVIVPSAGLESLDTAPESRTFKIADRAMRAVESDRSGIFVVNLPAADMVAESGNLEKTIESVQFVDTCLGGLVGKVRELGGVAIVTSSHAGCEEIGQPQYSGSARPKTPNPVPFHYIDDSEVGARLLPDGSLEDIAPTILGLLGLNKPAEMSGRDLRTS